MLSIHFARCVCRPVQLLMVLSSRERLSKLQRDIVVSLNYSYHIALQFNSFIYFSPCNRSNDDFCDFLSFAWERGECWACFAVNQFALILKFNRDLTQYICAEPQRIVEYHPLTHGGDKNCDCLVFLKRCACWLALW